MTKKILDKVAKMFGYKDNEDAQKHRRKDGLIQRKEKKNGKV